jgi:hypothetical protein
MVRCFAEPDCNFGGTGEQCRHDRELLIFLSYVRLVDAKRVDPDGRHAFSSAEPI